MRVPQRKSSSFRKYGGQTDNHLSEDAVSELKAEADRLENKVRPKTVADLTAAREMGDLSENAAYSMAKGKLAGIDRRLFEIREKLKNAIIIEKGPDEQGRARIGSTVTVEINGRERSFEITGSDETNPGSGRISHNSPVGSALIGKKAGDTATIDTGERQIEYRVISIS